MNLYESLRQAKQRKAHITEYLGRDRESRESRTVELMLSALGANDEGEMKRELKELDVTIKWLEDTISTYEEDE